MNKILLSAVLVVTVASGAAEAVSTSEQQSRTVTIAPCNNASKDEVAALVKRDFLQNRITRWDEDKKLLGTSTPVVWISTDSITGDSANWSVPVKARGNRTEKTYPVTLNCQLGQITYGTPH